MSIGNLIRNRRKKLGMTQEELAERVWVTPQAVSQWENGKTVPDLFNLSAIANALKMGKGELLGELDESRPSWVVRDSFYSVDNMRRKLRQFAAEDGLEQVDRAIDYAFDAHEGQMRKPSVFSDEQVPYAFHPFVMACHAHALVRFEARAVEELVDCQIFDITVWIRYGHPVVGDVHSGDERVVQRPFPIELRQSS